MARILYGLDRLPRTMGPDDPRLPGVPAAGGLLRLNTEPLAGTAMAETVGDHAGRRAAAQRWLEGLCGDYARSRRRFVALYVEALSAGIAADRTELAAGLARFDGLYAPEDWLWSAPRPLPRAWLPTAGGHVFAEVAFRLEAGPLALVLAETERERPLRTAGIPVCRIGPDVLGAGAAALKEALPKAFHRFWAGERLPMSPFRRAMPRLAGGSIASVRSRRPSPDH